MPFWVEGRIHREASGRDRLFSKPGYETPPDLIEDGLYYATAFALFTGPLWSVSVAMVAQALGATPEALAACELLTRLGADVTVVSPRKNGDDDAYAAGAAMAFHPAALDDEDEEDYGLVLDYVGDEGNRRGYVSCTLFDARHAQDWGLGEKRPPSLSFEPVVKRMEQALAMAPADVLEEAPSISKEFFNPIKTAASLAIGDASEAYSEALGWPADGETRKAKVAHEKCVGLERDVSRSLERIARLELVVSEKTALVGELTRLAREQRARAEAAEKQQKLHVTSIGDDISRYQTGPTKRTTQVQLRTHTVSPTCGSDAASAERR